MRKDSFEKTSLNKLNFLAFSWN